MRFPVLGPMEAEAELLQVFKLIDTDGSRSLSREEVTNFAANAPPAP